jgi:hypothetical protein
MLNKWMPSAIAAVILLIIACSAGSLATQTVATATVPPPTDTPAASETPTVAAPTGTPTPAPTPTLDPAAQEILFGKKAVSGVAGGVTTLYAFYGNEGDVVNISVDIVNTHPNYAAGFCAKQAPDAYLMLTTNSREIQGERQGVSRRVISAYELKDTGVYYVTAGCRGRCNSFCFQQEVLVEKP